MKYITKISLFFFFAVFFVVIFLLALNVANLYSFNDLYINSAFADEIFTESTHQGLNSRQNRYKKLRKRQDFSMLAKISEKAVVNISGKLTKKDDKGKKLKDNEIKITSLGSGFIISKDGYVLTNSHVVDKMEDIVVRFDGDLTPYKATLLGQDPQIDIALLKIKSDRKDFNFLYLGDSDKLNVGEWVVAIGNQFQLGQTVTAGIVSAVSRQVQGIQASPFANYIQTDASINPGSSGGPLLNSKGQVVGVNTAIFSPSRFGGAGFNIGIGFSTPINRVKKIINQLKEQGKVERGALGVIIQQVDEEVKEALNLPKIKGALVADILKGSVAEKIGIRAGDVIIKFNNYDINDFGELSLRVSEVPLGKEYELELIRDGVIIKKLVKIDKFDFEKATKEDKKNEPKKEDYTLGLLLKEINKKLVDILQIDDNGEGVLVVDIDEDVAYLDSGIQRGDLIKEMAGKKVKTLNDVKLIVNNLKEDKPFLILVKRGKNSRYLIYKIENKTKEDVIKKETKEKHEKEEINEKINEDKK
ncbi:MAG: trypsin-like peptidase domain-containing protein [Bdellovibrionota bacterium]